MLTKFFLMNTEAEKTRDALTLILDNLPDAVIMLDAGKLSYCNQQADSFFKVSLSHLTAN
jgi:PAS domain-containing protein